MCYGCLAVFILLDRKKVHVVRDPMRNPSFVSWMETEVEKIRNEYKEQRAKMSDDAFLTGLYNHDIKGTEAFRISSEKKQSFDDEEKAVSLFREKAIAHETRRMKLTEG